MVRGRPSASFFLSPAKGTICIVPLSMTFNCSSALSMAIPSFCPVARVVACA